MVRYNLFHMMPLCVNEITGSSISSCFLQETAYDAMAAGFKNHISRATPPEISEACDTLKQYGPFPEPFLKQNERFCRKWHQDYISLLIREDMRDISKVVDLDKKEIDFVITRDNTPLIAVEVKTGAAALETILDEEKQKQP